MDIKIRSHNANKVVWDAGAKTIVMVNDGSSAPPLGEITLRAPGNRVEFLNGLLRFWRQDAPPPPGGDTGCAGCGRSPIVASDSNPGPWDLHVPFAVLQFTTRSTWGRVSAIDSVTGMRHVWISSRCCATKEQAVAEFGHLALAQASSSQTITWLVGQSMPGAITLQPNTTYYVCVDAAVDGGVANYRLELVR